MAVTYTCIYLLSRADLVVFGYKIKTVSQTIGLFMITFAFYIVVGWSNEYVQFVTTGGWQGASVLFMQCEDGVSWWLISLLIQPVNPLLIWIDRVIAFSVVPFMLTLLGGLLASGKIRLR